MRHYLFVIFATLVATVAIGTDLPATAEEDTIRPAGDSDLSEFKWNKRALVVFADEAADPRFSEQIDLIKAQIDDLIERDVVVLTDTNASALSPVRRKLRPRSFMLVLVGKDGTVYLRKPFPWSVRDLSRSIDKMPLRQQEIRSRRGDQ